MSNHVTEWLNAYLDGELRNSRLHYVEAHLAECYTCRAELNSLEQLSTLLQNVPAAEFSPLERFAAQVSLRLPHQKAAPVRKKVFEIGWWIIPIGLLAIWIVMNAAFFVDDVLAVANSFGLLASVSDWWRLGTSSTTNWSSILGQIGVLRGNSLTLAASTETFTRTSLLQITLQVSIALLYLSWIAIWWALYARQQRGQPLEADFRPQ
jgi:predicted anti-sigma-YlaC factor YlaD